MNLNVVRLTIEERCRSASSEGTVLGCMRLLDVEEHATDPPVHGLCELRQSKQPTGPHHRTHSLRASIGTGSGVLHGGKRGIAGSLGVKTFGLLDQPFNPGKGLSTAT